jgi:hypothetical protein
LPGFLASLVGSTPDALAVERREEAPRRLIECSR